MSPGTTKQAASARNKLWTEIWAGRFERKNTCEACGAVGSLVRIIDAHHDDYAKPLDVRWLCRSCHAKHHAESAPPAKKRERAA